jgi:mannose-6-phosphate isomerase-like protein (cupin superfamily)
MSEEVLRAVFPASRYRVSTYRYEPGVPANGQVRRGTWHVIRGRGSLVAAGEITIIAAGDVLDVPAGPYSIDVLSEEPFEVVKVWDLETLLSEHGLKWTPSELPAKL